MSSADALQLGQFDPAEATDEELTALGTLQLAAYNDTRIPPPAPHNPPVNANFTIALPHNAQDVAGISIPHRGDFFGFSIEMSVVGQVCAHLFVFVFVFLVQPLTKVIRQWVKIRQSFPCVT